MYTYAYEDWVMLPQAGMMKRGGPKGSRVAARLFPPSLSWCCGACVAGADQMPATHVPRLSNQSGKMK